MVDIEMDIAGMGKVTVPTFVVYEYDAETKEFTPLYLNKPEAQLMRNEYQLRELKGMIYLSINEVG